MIICAALLTYWCDKKRWQWADKKKLNTNLLTNDEAQLAKIQVNGKSWLIGRSGMTRPGRDGHRDQTGGRHKHGTQAKLQITWSKPKSDEKNVMDPRRQQKHRPGQYLLGCFNFTLDGKASTAQRDSITTNSDRISDGTILFTHNSVSPVSTHQHRCVACFFAVREIIHQMKAAGYFPSALLSFDVGMKVNEKPLTHPVICDDLVQK